MFILLVFDKPYHQKEFSRTYVSPPPPPPPPNTHTLSYNRVVLSCRNEVYFNASEKDCTVNRYQPLVFLYLYRLLDLWIETLKAVNLYILTTLSMKWAGHWTFDLHHVSKIKHSMCEIVNWKYSKDNNATMTSSNGNIVRYWPFVRGIHRSPVDDPHKGQWRGALMYSVICAWWKRLNKRDTGDWRHHRVHYDVTVIQWPYVQHIETRTKWPLLMSYFIHWIFRYPMSNILLTSHLFLLLKSFYNSWPNMELKIVVVIRIVVSQFWIGPVYLNGLT